MMNTGDKGRGVGSALAIFGAAALAWGWLLTGAGVDMHEMDMGGGNVMLMRPEWTLGYAALVLAMWVVMMVAMMLPSAASAILGAASPLAFAAAYLAIWTGFSLAATFAQFALDRSELLSDAMAVRGDFAVGLLILAVGLYQFTPLKHSCLQRCASSFRRDGTATQSVLEGLRYGANCLGCCWALMTLLFVAGLMNLLWVAAIALWLTAEKLLPWGGRIARIAGAALAAWGSTLLASALA